MQIKQQSSQSLSQYEKRFRAAVSTVTDLNIPQALGFFTTKLDMEWSQKLMKNIMFNLPKDLSKVYDRTENFITIDDAMGSLKPQSRWADQPRDRDNNYNPRPDTQMNKETRNGSARNDKPPFRHRFDNKLYTPLNTDHARILNEIRDKPFFSGVRWVIREKRIYFANTTKVWDIRLMRSDIRYEVIVRQWGVGTLCGRAGKAGTKIGWWSGTTSGTTTRSGWAHPSGGGCYIGRFWWTRDG